MLLEGMTDADYNRFAASRRPNASQRPPPPPGPPPPPPPPIGNMPKVIKAPAVAGSLPFLADIMNGNFALKKMDGTKANAASTMKSKVLKGVDTSKMFHVTLEDILAAKANLGKGKNRK